MKETFSVNSKHVNGKRKCNHKVSNKNRVLHNVYRENQKLTNDTTIITAPNNEEYNF